MVSLSLVGSLAVASGALVLSAWQQKRIRDLVRRSKRNDALLDIVYELSAVEVPMDEQAEAVLSAARALVSSERCALFLYEKASDELVSCVMTGGAKVRFPASRGIAGYSAKSGQTVVCNDVSKSKYFNPEVDMTTGFRTRCVLSVPIISQGTVIAVAQLVNKTGPRPDEGFSYEDEETMRAFSQVIALVLRNKGLYEHLSQICEEREVLLNVTTATTKRRGSLGPTPGTKKSDRALDVAKAAVDRFIQIKLSEVELQAVRTVEFDVLQYGIHTSAEQHDKLIPLAVFFIKDLQLGILAQASDDMLVRLLLAVRATYRRVPYHNFAHAFDVAHALYLYLKVGGLNRVFTELEQLVLIIVGLFHDCDHSGVNNSFHTKALTPLGILSDATGSHSVLETHHCNVAIEVLSDPKCDVFSVLSAEDRTLAWRLVIDCILATDMARHNALCAEFKDLEGEGAFDASKPDHRRAAMLLLTKAADISNLWKTPGISVNWSRLVNEEFFVQGDKEKATGIAVTPSFDRDKAQELKKSTLGFLNFVGVPFFTQVASVFSSLSFTKEGVLKNKSYWESQ